MTKREPKGRAEEASSATCAEALRRTPIPTNEESFADRATRHAWEHALCIVGHEADCGEPNCDICEEARHAEPAVAVHPEPARLSQSDAPEHISKLLGWQRRSWRLVVSFHESTDPRVDSLLARTIQRYVGRDPSVTVSLHSVRLIEWDGLTRLRAESLADRIRELGHGVLGAAAIDPFGDEGTSTP